MKLFLSLFALIVLTAPAAASSRPYGSDGLPYLCAKDSLVIVGKAPKAEAEFDKFYEYYSLQVDNVLKGKSPKEVRFLSQKGTAFPADAQIYFLSAGESKGAAFYAYEVHQASTEDVKDAVVEWIGADTASKRMAFVEKHLKSTQPFLKRSAWLALEILLREKKTTLNAATVDAAIDGLNDREVNWSLAVRILVAIDTEKAVEPLKAIVQDDKEPLEKRSSVLQMLIASSRGLKFIGTAQFDKELPLELRNYCVKIALLQKGMAPALDEATFEKFKADMESGKRFQQVRALDTVSEFAASKELVEYLKNYLVKYPDKAMRVRIPDVLGRLGSLEKGSPIVAPLLEEMALDDSDPESQSSAVLATGHLWDLVEAAKILRKVESRFKDTQAGKLAKVLADDFDRRKRK